MNELALFAGAGGGILGGHLLGWRTVCAVECDCYAASVLVQRQNDGILQPFPVWDDVRTFDGKPWRGIVQVVSGGFPCTDISVAGKGAGIDGEASGLWSEMARIVDEVRPVFVYVENSPALTIRGLGRVLGDLAAMGFDAQWGVLGAVHSGAPHKRERIWIVGNSGSYGRKPQRDDNREHDRSVLASNGKHPGKVAYTDSQHVYHPGFSTGEVSQQQTTAVPGVLPDSDCIGAQVPAPGRFPTKQKPRVNGGSHWWATEPDVGRVANGVAARVDRLKAIGNGQVPAVAADAFKILAQFRF